MNQDGFEKGLTPRNNQLLHLLKSGQLLALSDVSSGVILRKPYFAEFVGAGGAVGGVFDVGVTSIYPLGEIQFLAPTTTAERRQAFQNRIAYTEKIQEITLAETPVRRASLLLRQLDEWVGTELTQWIPDDLLSLIVGVFPETIKMARLCYLSDDEAIGSEAAGSEILLEH